MARRFHAIHRYARIAPRKARLVVDLIRGRLAEEALEILRFTSKRGAILVHKVLRSAISNASADPEVEIGLLRVAEVRIDGGPIAHRWMPRARGVATPIQKRTSHITVVVEHEPKPKRARRSAAPPGEPKADAGKAGE